MSSIDESALTPANSPQTPSATPSPCTTCGKRGETLPPASASKKPKLDDNSSNIEFIEKFLECSICLDFPASPIHSCDYAHFLCGRCAPKFRTCPTCRNPKLQPNPACEKLAKEANKKIECENLEAGCKGGVLSTKFVDHLASCFFREIQCNYTVGCRARVKFHEYPKHLEDAHKVKIVIGPKLRGSYLYDEKQHVKSGSVLNKWGGYVLNFKSHVFFVHARVSRKSGLFYSWVCILGDKDLADKYYCEVEFMPFDKYGCSWKLPVLPFHEIPGNDNQSEAKLFEYSGRLAVSALPMVLFRKSQWGEDKIIPIDVRYEIKDA